MGKSLLHCMLASNFKFPEMMLIASYADVPWARHTRLPHERLLKRSVTFVPRLSDF